MAAPSGHRPAAAWSSRAACVRGLVVVALAGASFVAWGSAPSPTSTQPATQAAQPAQPTATPIPVPRSGSDPVPLELYVVHVAGDVGVPAGHAGQRPSHDTPQPDWI